MRIAFEFRLSATFVDRCGARGSRARFIVTSDARGPRAPQEWRRARIYNFSLAPVLRGEGRGEGHAVAQFAPHPQPLSPEYKGEGSHPKVGSMLVLFITIENYSDRMRLRNSVVT